METKNVKKINSWTCPPPLESQDQTNTDSRKHTNKDAISIVINTKNYTVEIEID